jgi:ribosomal protein S27AE
MAVEAQLCPQCGGSIQFALYQSQVICPYCGTTVDKIQPKADGESLALPRAPSLSDLTTNKLTQLMQMAFEGQRTYALAFIHQNLGLDEAQASKLLDDKIDRWIDQWKSEYR